MEGAIVNAELKAKWLEALRSGKYDQISGQLRVGNCFCCLGVLCDIANPKGWDDEEWNDVVGEEDGEDYGVTRCVSELPDRFRSRIGMTFEHQERLVRMNDDERKSFSQIADYIEAKL